MLVEQSVRDVPLEHPSGQLAHGEVLSVPGDRGNGSGWAGQPRHPQARGDVLAEAARLDDGPLAIVEREQAVGCRAVVEEVVIAIVVQHGEPDVPGQLHQPLASIAGQDRSRGGVKGGHRIDQPGTEPHRVGVGEALAHRLDIDPVLVDRHGEHRGPRGLHETPGIRIRDSFDDGGVSRPYQGVHGHGDAVHRAVGQQKVSLGQPGALVVVQP